MRASFVAVWPTLSRYHQTRDVDVPHTEKQHAWVRPRVPALRHFVVGSVEVARICSGLIFIDDSSFSGIVYMHSMPASGYPPRDTYPLRIFDASEKVYFLAVLTFHDLVAIGRIQQHVPIP